MNKPQQRQNFKISFIGGVGEIGKNMMALEYGNDIVIIDAGLTFPTDDMPGVDIVIPDITYILQNKDKIRGIVLTHGHEDHIGALPYLLSEIHVPVYGSRLTLALVENKLKEHKKVKMKGISVKPRSIIKLGCFTIEFLKVSHSIQGAFALAITTPVGVYMHTGDFKFDLTPIDNDGIDLIRLSEIAKKGVLLLTADSTNAECKGFSMSEKKVGETLNNIFVQNKTKRIIVATFASNIHRLQQILDVAEKNGRKVVFTGRSMLNVAETASKIGELKLNKNNIVDVTYVDKYADNELCIITTGTQGEPNSALTRMATGKFPKIEISENDLVVFSSSSIPGNEKSINNLINDLYKCGADIIYESLAAVHASGHASQEELKILHYLIKPKFFMPCHGEYRQQRAHKLLAQELGMEARNILIPENGDQIAVGKNFIKKIGTIPFGTRLIDGFGMSDVGSIVLRDRVQLSEEGLCVVVISVSKETGVLTSKPDIISRGFIYSKGNENFLEEAKDVVINAITSADFKTQDWITIKNQIKKVLTAHFYRKFKSKPLVLPIILETK